MNKPQPRKPVNPLHHIERYDNETNNAHYCRVTVKRNNKSTIKFFKDSVFGDKKKTLQAAIRYRDELLAKTDVYALLIGYRTNLQSNNKSGISGVRRVERIDKRYPNNRRIYWVVSWKNEYGVRCGRHFPIKLYGEAGARQMAIDERECQLKRVCAILAARPDAHINGCRING